jgi:hypothetical protein
MLPMLLTIQKIPSVQRLPYLLLKRSVMPDEERFFSGCQKFFYD